MIFKEYIKWLFTRWYLYALSSLWFSYNGGSREFTLPGIVIGSILGNIVLWAILISIIIGFKILFLSFFTSGRDRNNPKLSREQT